MSTLHNSYYQMALALFIEGETEASWYILLYGAELGWFGEGLLNELED